MSDIPFEDDITKTSLWKRIDSVFPVIANVKEELYPQITSMHSSLQPLIDTQVTKVSQLIEAYNNELKARWKEQVDTINGKIIDALYDINARSEVLNQKLEKRIQEIVLAIPKVVDKETQSLVKEKASELYDVVDKKIKQINEDLPKKIEDGSQKVLEEQSSILLNSVRQEVKNLHASLPTEITEQTTLFINNEYEKNIKDLKNKIADLEQTLPGIVLTLATNTFTEQLENFRENVSHVLQKYVADIPSIVVERTKQFLEPYKISFNSVLGNYTSFKKEIETIIGDKFNYLISEYKNSIHATEAKQVENNNKFIDLTKADLDSRLKQHTAEINKIIFSAVDRIAKDNLAIIRGLEEKIRVMQSTLPSIVKKETQDYLMPTNTKVSDIAKDLELFKKSLMATVGKFGTELTTKISSLNEKLETTLKKFRNLSSAI